MSEPQLMQFALGPARQNIAKKASLGLAKRCQPSPKIPTFTHLWAGQVQMHISRLT